MDELLQVLEERIHSIFRRLSDLQKVNGYLEQNKLFLSQENTELQTRHQIAIQHIENMVSHLKSIEGLS